MAKTFWQDSPFGEDSLFHPNFGKQQDPKSQTKPKVTANLLIVLDPENKSQFDDTKNTIWKVRHVKSLSDYTTVSGYVKDYNFKNLCLVHHGNVYSATTLPEGEKVVFGVARMKQMDTILAAVEEKPFLELTDDYFTALHDKSKELFIGGYPLLELKAYVCLRGLIANINASGNYFSVACDEADDPLLLEHMSTYAKNDITLFANSNYSLVERSNWFKYGEKKITDYGSILNSFLTSNWLDNSGWKYYKMSEKTLTVTNKDLWLFSKHKSKVYELIARKKDLTSTQKEKEQWAQIYFSKKFEKWYVTNWGQPAYDKFALSIETKYPEFKQ